MKKVNKAAEIRTLLAEGVSVDDIAKKLKVPKPYVVQVRWHWQGGKKAKKSQPKKLLIQPQNLDKALKLLGSTFQKEEVTETFSGLFGDAPQKQEDTLAKFDDKAAQGIGWVSITEDDAVNSPAHYTEGGIETIDFIEAKKLNYHLGNVIKYVSRCGLKSDNPLEDLKKAQWYLNREIENLSGDKWDW